jgi:cytochrome c oxidase cbb3-type subunit 1
MSQITVWFIRFALIYFMLAILLGLHMSVTGPVYPWMPIHVHFNLLGWMSMMIYGVGYHILPRFSGVPLWSEKLSYWQMWLANIGLVGMAVGWIVRSSAGNPTVLLVFAFIEGVSMVFFAINMFKTIKAAPAPVKK